MTDADHAVNDDFVKQALDALSPGGVWLASKLGKVFNKAGIEVKDADADVAVDPQGIPSPTNDDNLRPDESSLPANDEKNLGPDVALSTAEDDNTAGDAAVVTEEESNESPAAAAHNTAVIEDEVNDAHRLCFAIEIMKVGKSINIINLIIISDQGIRFCSGNEVNLENMTLEVKVVDDSVPGFLALWRTVQPSIRRAFDESCLFCCLINTGSDWCLGDVAILAHSFTYWLVPKESIVVEEESNEMGEQRALTKRAPEEADTTIIA